MDVAVVLGVAGAWCVSYIPATRFRLAARPCMKGPYPHISSCTGEWLRSSPGFRFFLLAVHHPIKVDVHTVLKLRFPSDLNKKTKTAATAQDVNAIKLNAPLLVGARYEKGA